MRWWLTIVAVLIASPVVAQTMDRSADESLLRENRLPTNGTALLEILRDRTISVEIQQRFKKLVTACNANAYATRNKATADLIKMDPVVLPLLVIHLREARPDAETTARLRHILEHFPAEKDHQIIAATARLIARDKPADSLRVLLDFVPYVTDELVRQEVQIAINAVAIVDKKPAPLIVTALKDGHPARQAAAAEALVRTVGLNAKSQIAHLMVNNAHPQVRYQLGLALTEKHDKSGLPLLIESLGDAPLDRVLHAEEVLYRAAGEKAPQVFYRDKSTAGTFTRAWMGWFQQYESTLDLAKALDTTELGQTIIASATPGKANTRDKIFAVDKSKEIRWEFDAPRYLRDLQVIGPNRLLMAEYMDRRVTERDFKGELLWQVPVNLPLVCQRLVNGHTFIANRQALLIVDREGKEVFTWFQQNASIVTACCLRNRHTVVVANTGLCSLLDPQGRQIKSVQLAPFYVIGSNIELLPNGRLLAPQYTQNCVIEVDWEGNRHWQANVGRPTGATRLKNGNTLVSCALDYRVVELNPAGEEVWSYPTEGRAIRARRR